jgi:hypothetical protein
MPSFLLRELPGRFAIARLEEDAPLPPWALAHRGLAAVVRRPGELSVVCAHDAVPAGVTAEGPWAALAGALAVGGVPVFVLSRYDTDVILVREPDLDRATEALRAAGHRVERSPGVSRFS